MTRCTQSASSYFILLSITAVAALAVCDQDSWADQILENYSASLTTYLSTSKTPVQDLRPLVDQRGVNIDGVLRHGSVFPMALAGNPFGEGWDSNIRLGSVRLDTGTYVITDVDLAPPAPGFSWVIGRSYNCRQKDSGGSYFDSNGYQGRNWSQMSQPEIRLYTGATADLDVVYLVYGADRFIEFKRFGVNSNQFKAKNGAAGVMDFGAGAANEPDTYTYTDPHGNKFVFFGFDVDAGVASGQFWKVTDPNGNSAYAGDASTGSTAISNGYDGSGRLTTVYQGLASSATRRFTYTYTSNLLTKVEIAEKPSGGSYTNTGEKVEYAYYVNADSHGEDKDLKLVTITTPLTDSGINLVRKTGYWCYEGTYNGTTNPGYVHQIQYIIGFEGYRKMDALDSTDDDDPLSASESDMKPYASAFFKYDTDRRITSAWFNGSCGCAGGSGTGTQNFTYESNGGFSGSSGYDTTWKTRTIVQMPDSSYLTQYFDEVGQPLSRVVSDGDPAVTSGRSYWPTQVTRNSDGQLTEIDSPANISSYTHSSASFSSSSSDGLITLFTRISSTDMKGFVEDTKHKKGSSGSAYLDGELAYTSAAKTVTDVVVTRPLISSRRVYSTEVTSGTSGSYLTSMSYSMHSSDGVLMPKQITTTYPTVTTGNNGSNSATTTDQYLRKDGTTAFTANQDGIFNYTQFTNGELVKSIADAQTNNGSDFASGDDPNTDFGVTENGNGLRKITTYAYDTQGRLDSTTLPGSMVKKNYYSTLKDHRLVVLNFNDYGGGKFFGPVNYTVQTHSGRPEASATIKLTNNESTTALTGWIDETDADPITAVDVGTVARLSTTVYDKAGGRVDESRSYTTIPASGAGSSGTNYDPTTFGYDDSGRRWRVKQADGTITRTVFDSIGRFSASWLGTNDNSFSGGESSGPDNMVKVSDVVYDAAAVGNSYVTKRTAYIQDNTTGKRETTMTNDVRGRALLQTNPTAPHTFNKFDNMGRLIASAQYSSTASIDTSTDDPTSEATNRLTLNETFFDERGMVWKTLRHKIDQSDGSDDDNLETLTWYDAPGRVIKVDGDQLTKTGYDRLGRAIHQYILASVDDTVYADADDVSGDIVLQQNDTVYDSTEDVVDMVATIERYHSDYGGGETTGALDSNADADDLKYTAANLKGRIQITSFWYDAFDRKTDEVRYGNNGASDLNRSGLSVPARSDTALRTTWTYNTDGSLLSITDPRALETRYTYDDAGRQTVMIANYVNGTPSGDTRDDDNYTRFAYTSGHKTKMWVDFDGDNVEDSNDQVTTWTFGVTKGASAGDSKISSNSLLYKVVYPPQSGGQAEADRRVLYAYNAQGQAIWMKDAETNVTEYDYDDSGRRTQQRLTTLGGSFDSGVLRIATTYDSLGRTQLVTQYDNATVGSGTVQDEVKYTYSDWPWLVSNFEMDKDSTVGAGGSTDDYEVKYTFAKSTGGRNTIQRSTMKLAYASTDLATLTYEYSSTSGLHDADASRVSDIKVSTTVIASYDYNGVGSVVGTNLPEPDMYSNRYTAGSPGTYPDLDNFNRITTFDWTKNLSTDRDTYKITVTYDRDSNISRAVDGVSTGRDVAYTMDNLNRLTKAEEGTWNGSAITSRTRQEIWTLTQTGNMDLTKLDLNGDNDFVDASEYNDTRTHNNPNELTAQDTDSNGSNNYTLTYNKDGQMTDDGRFHKMVYDGFGRLRKINNQSNALVEEFWYNGLGYRKAWKYDTDSDNDVDSNDKKYYFAYDERWRNVATYRETDTTPKEEFFHHAAGADGMGGSSYIDSVVLREKDANTSWTSATDGVLEERRYYNQNWRADVVEIVKSTGDQVERAWDFSYGVAFGRSAGECTEDGIIDSSDPNQINTWIIGSTYDVRGDLDRDGDVDTADKTAATANIGNNGGRKVLSLIGNRRGYAGYQCDPVASYFLADVRHRELNADLGRWITRDPLEYDDGSNLYQYGRLDPTVLTDPLGTGCGVCPSGQICVCDVMTQLCLCQTMSPQFCQTQWDLCRKSCRLKSLAGVARCGEEFAICMSAAVLICIFTGPELMAPCLVIGTALCTTAFNACMAGVVLERMACDNDCDLARMQCDPTWKP